MRRPSSSPHRYGVFLRGDAPLTSRLFEPVPVDAQTAVVTDSRDLPWYPTILLVSQPLHFGNYGGMPLRIIWAALDVATLSCRATASISGLPGTAEGRQHA